MANVIQAPATLAEALRLAADLATQNEELERQLAELRLNSEYPEVLRPAHMKQLFGFGSSKISEMTRDPTFPILNKNRRKGEAVLVLKADLYNWLKHGEGAKG